MQSAPRVVICGAGIMGCSIAYHLALRGVGATVVERCAPACGASGKAGGFLAATMSDTSALAKRSFAMHEELGRTFSGTGYRQVDALSVVLRDTKRKVTGLPAWVDGSAASASLIGKAPTLAQVHPERLTKAFLDHALAKGAKLVTAQVVGVEFVAGSTQKQVSGVRLASGEVLPADVVVIAMGPWSSEASAWLPIPAVRGRKAHSIVLRPKVDLSPHMLFLSAGTDDPEIYPRPDGTVYICGQGSATPLPANPDQVVPDPGAIDILRNVAAQASSALGASVADLEREQACYLPISPDGEPLIGRVPGVGGAYVATGHSCWGILNAPATGLVVAELITEGRTSVDISEFDPARFCRDE